MDENNSSLGRRSLSIWPTALKWALIIAAFKVIYDLLIRTTGLAGNVPGLPLIGIVVTVVLLVLALRGFRARNDSYMTFGQGFGIAFVASVIAIVISAAVGSIYLAMYGEQQLNAQLEATLAQVQANPSVDPEAMEVLAGFFGAVFTPGGLFVAAIIVGTIGWTVVSLILAAVLKNPPPLRD